MNVSEAKKMKCLKVAMIGRGEVSSIHLHLYLESWDARMEELCNYLHFLSGKNLLREKFKGYIINIPAGALGRVRDPRGSYFLSIYL